MKCPPNWSPGCTCSSQALEPSESCYDHGSGYFLWMQCPYCGQFRGKKSCKRCGCDYGLKDIKKALETIWR